MAAKEAREAVGEYKAGWHDPENATIRFDFGLSEQVVRDISALKNEPDWMTEIRVKAFHHFEDIDAHLGKYVNVGRNRFRCNMLLSSLV